MSDQKDYMEQYSRIGQILAPNLAQDWPRLPVTRAEGIYLYTADGRRIMDFISGFAVANVGHNHPKIVAAAREQMEKMVHAPMGVIFCESLLELAHRLPEVLPSGLDMFFFGNSGAEAVEGALKLARYVSGRQGIISFTGGFHGRSYGAASITSIKALYRQGYQPFVPGVHFTPYAYPYRCPDGSEPEVVTAWAIGQLQKVFDHIIPPSEVAALVLEPIQGEGGYIMPPPGFLHELRRICDQHGILLIFDEIQTGFGRTGQMFASQTYDVRPDIMAIAKGIANGFPLSATVASREAMSKWAAGTHGTTFGGNPIACAAAVATLDVIEEEGLLANCRAMGERFLAGLKELEPRFEQVGEVRGQGLMLALEFIHPGQNKAPNPEAATKFLEGCLERDIMGVKAGTYGQVVRFMPPLTIDAALVDLGLEVMQDTLQSM